MKPARLECPTCKRAIEWSDEFPYRPFCSERCRLIDLGAWISGERAIPGDAAAPDEDADPTLPRGPRPARND